MSIRAKESIVAQKLSTGGYRYAITLKDTGTTQIGAFWFAWTFSGNLLTSKPRASAPSGWTEQLQGGSEYSIQWMAKSGHALKAGQSMTFDFTSSEKPAAVFGESSTQPGTKVSTSFVYESTFLVGPSDEFSASSTKVVNPTSWDAAQGLAASEADAGLFGAAPGQDPLQGFDLFSNALAGGGNNFGA